MSTKDTLKNVFTGPKCAVHEVSQATLPSKPGVFNNTSRSYILGVRLIMHCNAAMTATKHAYVCFCIKDMDRLGTSAKDQAVWRTHQMTTSQTLVTSPARLKSQAINTQQLQRQLQARLVTAAAANEFRVQWLLLLISHYDGFMCMQCHLHAYPYVVRC